MSIKIFAKGLGQSDHPFSVSDPVQITGQGSGFIERDKNVILSEQEPAQDNFAEGTLRTFVQLARDDVRKNPDSVIPPGLSVRLTERAKVFSSVSGQVPFETLFHDFNLEVFPFYNFWVPDELTNDRDERGERKLEDIPRFIKVTWDAAPDIPDPEIAKKKVPKQVNKRTIKPVLFAQELLKPNVFRSKGVDFAPKYLQPEGLSSILGIIANGHMAPGVLETVVDLPLHTAGVIQPVVPSLIDEDSFLNDPSTRGISIHELRAQTLQVTHGTLVSSNVGRDGVAPSLNAQKEALVDQQFNIVKSPFPGGSMNIQGIQKSSPNISITSKTATVNKVTPIDNPQAMLEKFIQAEPFTDVPKTAQTKVKFFDPSIGAIVSSKKVQLMSAPEHIETMASIAPNLPSLELLARSDYYVAPRKFEIPSLPSPKLKQLEYIGYVLEKYRRSSTGVFVKDGSDIVIPNREVNEYYDTKVLYGETYRYRIRSILRWNRPLDQGVMGKDPTVSSRFASQAIKLASHQNSYFYSEWTQQWAYGTCMDDQPPPPPDELNVRPESHRKRVVVTFRLPENRQKDILSMRLFKKIQGEDGRDLTDWLPMVHFDGQVDAPPQNVLIYDLGVEFFQNSKMRYVYAAQCVSRHNEMSYLSEQLGVRLNQDYKTRGEYLVDFVSSAGVRMEHFGAFTTIPAKQSRSELVIVPPKSERGSVPGAAALIVTGRDTMGRMQGIDGDYVIRVTSLDTGEVYDIPFTTSFQYLPTREIFILNNVFTVQAEPQRLNSNAIQTPPSRVLTEKLTIYQDPKEFGGQMLAHVPNQKTENLLTLPTDRAFPLDRFKR